MKRLLLIVTSKEFWFGVWFAIIALAMILVGASINSATAQSVVRKDKTFKSPAKKADDVLNAVRKISEIKRNRHEKITQNTENSAIQSAMD